MNANRRKGVILSPLSQRTGIEIAFPAYPGALPTDGDILKGVSPVPNTMIVVCYEPREQD